MKLRHIGIVVATENVQFSKNFYQNLGFKVVKEKIEEGFFIEKILGIDRKDFLVHTIKMSNGDFMIELLDFYHHNDNSSDVNLQTKGCTHFSVTVENAEDIYDMLTNLGAKPVSEPTVSENGSVKVFFAKDPYCEVWIEVVEELS